MSTKRTALMILVGAGAALSVFTLATLPPAHARLTTPVPATVAVGGFHVHTTRSDGSGTPDEVARAAANAGLQFVILTDHGDATRPPDPPAYQHGVLVIDAVEISTTHGHVVALNLAKPAPYRLAGEARDVVEDIHRLGGFAIAAHPDSPKPELRWTDWTTPVDGLEWINADSEWRDESALHLAATLLRSWIRGPESVASLFARPARTITRWDVLTRRRSLVALGALDAHAHLPWREDAVPVGRTWLAQPSYGEMFRTLAQGVTLDRPLSGTAGDDASRVLGAIVAGHTFTIVRAIADPAALAFTATQDGRTVTAGDRIDVAGETTTLNASVPGAANVKLVLLQNGREVRSALGALSYTGPLAPGAYRIEAFYPTSPMPWLFSNPIYVGPVTEDVATPEATPDPAAAPPVTMSIPATSDWSIEHQPASTGTATVDGDAVRVDYTLGAASASDPYTALVTGVGEDHGFDRLAFIGRADRPMRVSVQLRLRGNADRRWRRSVYLDPTPRPVSIAISDLQPTGADTALRPNVALVRAVLFVVDTLNAAPGAHGTFWISHLTFTGPAGDK